MGNEKLKNAEETLSKRLENHKHSYAPAYKLDCDGNPYHAGTITSLIIENQQFLVTARHVLDKDEANDSDQEFQIFLMVDGILRQIQKFEVIQVTINNRELDFCLLYLPEMECNRIISTPIPEESTSAVNISSGTYLAACGFPATKNKRNGNKLSKNPHAFCGFIASEKIKENPNYPKDEHFYIEIDLKRTYSKGQRSIAAADPNGISGGPVFSFNNTNFRPESELPFEGIAIAKDKKKKFLVCIKAKIITTAAKNFLHKRILNTTVHLT